MIKKLFKKSPILSKAKVRHYEDMLVNLEIQRQNIKNNIDEVELKLGLHYIAVINKERNDE